MANTKAYIKLDNFQKKINEALIIPIPRQDMLVIGTEIANKIKIRTRIGQGVDGKKLKILSPSYIAYRSKHRRDLYDDTTPKRSNLTYTGQLLNSMKVASIKAGQFIIYFKNERKPMQTKKGKRNSNITNSDITYYQKEKGRDFFGLSEAEKKYLAKRIITYFKERFAL